MKLLVEFETKQEMDAFFAASEQGGLAPVQAVYLVNKMGQSIGVKMTTKDDEPDAAVIEVYMRGEPECSPMLPHAALKVV